MDIDNNRLIRTNDLPKLKTDENQNASVGSSLETVKETRQDNHPNKSKKRSVWPWIVTAGVAIAVLVIALTTKREDKVEVSFVDQVENFVNRTESLSSSFDATGWENADAEFGAYLSRYKRVYDSLSPSELDRVDDAVERYNILFRRYRGTPAVEKISSFVVDDIEYSYDNPTVDQLHQWKNKYANTCASKLVNMDFYNYDIPYGMKEKHPCLVYLLMKSRSLSKKEEKQNWFNLYSFMDDEKVDKLYDILYREAYQIAEVEKKYELKRQINQLNVEAYEYAKTGDFYNAYLTIDHAIALDPDNPNVYDSKGEFYLMQGRLDKALSMWNKVMNLDSNFLSTYGGHTNLYDGLLEKGMINH